MQQLKLAGRIFYAAGLSGLAILCFVYKDFIVGRPPASVWASFNPAMAYLGGGLLIICCVFVLTGKQVTKAAFAIAALLVVFSLLRYIPSFQQDWLVLNAYKTLALIGGSIIVASGYNKEYPSKKLHILIGCILLAIFLIIGGYAHFKYADFVISFIPAYLPLHEFFTYFCGICLIAGGIGILIPATRSLAALLSGIMIMGWFLLLHIPRLVANPTDMSDRFGLFESFAFAGICFVLAAISRSKRSTMHVYQ